MSDVYAHMLSYEMRIEQNNSNVQVSLANHVSRNQGCGGNGGGRNNRGRSRSGGRSPSGRGGHGQSSRSGADRGVLCQVCNKTGHDALRCWYRFDHSYQAEDANKVAAAVTNGYSVDPNWYIDTDATDHLTNDLDRLTTRTCYTGGDQVQVANGEGMSIAYVGNSFIAGIN
ncbi:Zinc finger CCHC-type protein [Dioscorea alata]|uniref:Zinc finger CCHC-type protein n=1 Tax=Dioscorea alata TaxID=55571 RepID=A0ACB7UR59_DIOAL|nr:Zinc finger CCHC-type protein [Dioscorea alata]